MKRILIFSIAIFALILLLAACNNPEPPVNTETSVDTESHVHTEVVDAAVDATCTQAGLTEGKHCSVCGEVIVEQTVIPALDHTEVVDAAIDATCTQTGLTEGKHCSVCSEILVAQEQTSVINCRFGWVTDKQPTNTEDGIRNYRCYMCGTTEVSEILYAGTQNLTYGQYEDGTYYVKSTGQAQETEIVIPKKYNGQPVTGIGSNAIGKHSVVIHEGIIHIAEDAFQSKDLMLEYSVANITVDPNNPVYTSIDGNLYSKDGKTLLRYAPAKQEETFTIPEGVTTIGRNAFTMANSLVHIILPESVTVVGDEAFQKCWKLRQIDMPNSLTEIGRGAFYDCEELESVVLPDSLTYIAPYAFMYCRSLKSVTLPQGITELSDGLFFICGSLTHVELPDSITSIGEMALAACYSIQFAGSTEQWLEIQKHPRFTNCADTYVVYCSDGRVDHEGNILP